MEVATHSWGLGAVLILFATAATICIELSHRASWRERAAGSRAGLFTAATLGASALLLPPTFVLAAVSIAYAGLAYLAQRRRAGSAAWIHLLVPTVYSFSTALLAALWSSLPPRLPVHWDLMGRPTDWAPRSSLSVFAVYVVGILLHVFLVAMWSRKLCPAVGSKLSGSATILFAEGVVLVTISLLGLSPLVSPEGDLGRLWSIILGLPLAFGLGVLLTRLFATAPDRAR